MPAPVLSQDQWDEVEKAAVAGVPFTELAERYGIEDNAIRQRAFWKKWAVPNRIQKLKAEYLANRGTSDSESTENNPDKPDQKGRDLTASNVLAETVAEYGQKGQLAVLKGLMPWLEKTFSPENPLLQAPADSMKVAATGANLFAKFSGLDKPQQAVQVNVWGAPGQSGSTAGACWDVPETDNTPSLPPTDDSERSLGS